MPLTSGNNDGASIELVDMAGEAATTTTASLSGMLNFTCHYAGLQSIQCQHAKFILKV